MFATCCEVGTNSVQIIPSTSSFIKCLSILIWFILLYIAGLWVMLIAVLLSQCNIIRRLTGLLSSSRTLLSQRISHIPCAIDLNYASTLLLATTQCFLLLQVTKLSHRNIQYLDVNLLSATELVFSASVYTP